MTRPKNPAYEYLPDKRGVLKAHVRIICETCGTEAMARVDGRKRFCSKRCAVTKQHAEGKSHQASGSEHYAWKGSEAKYQALHTRVMRLRGKADHCEWRPANGCASLTYEWAHIHDTDPGDAQNYISLCKTCHKRYDKQTGADNTQAKLTAAQVAEIRLRYAAGGVSQRALGAEYGLKQPTVSSIILGRSYR